ncbi:MAG: ATP-binding protein [Gammaproteobacteria bacterium]
MTTSRPRSRLSTRLLLASSLILAAFVSLAGLALQRAHLDSLLVAERDQLQVLVYLLLGEAELDAAGTLTMPAGFQELRLDTPNSGLYAAVSDTAGKTLWRSPSSLGLTVTYPGLAAGSEPRLSTQPGDDGSFRVLSYPVTWELDAGTTVPLVFHVARDSRDTDAQAAAFRRTLWTWLAAAAAALLAAQLIALGWAIRPLSAVAREVHQIERGERKRLSSDVPHELHPLTQGLNRYIESGESRLRRHREAIADLAHSLKTPTAVLRGIASDCGEPNRRGINEQLDRMDQSIAFHQQRGSAAGRKVLSEGIAIKAVIDRLAASLTKVYAEKGVVIETDARGDARFPGDEGDLMEILGNLMDNACKWAAHRVRVTVSAGDGLLIRVEDDGPGFPPEGREDLLGRGVRADQRRPGQGIGLAVVREIVEDDYRGRVSLGNAELGDSEPGGARVELRV